MVSYDLPVDINFNEIFDSKTTIVCLMNQNKSFSKLATKIKIPSSNEQKDLTYSQLPGSDIADREKIIELFATMGSKGKMDLLMHYKSHLEKIGQEIEHVHPLKLLGVVFSVETLKEYNMKEYMDNVYHDYFKWTNFYDKGILPNLKNEVLKNNLFQYMEDFAQEVGVAPESISGYFNKQDWEGLIKYLIKN